MPCNYSICFWILHAKLVLTRPKINTSFNEGITREDAIRQNNINMEGLETRGKKIYLDSGHVIPENIKNKQR